MLGPGIIALNVNDEQYFWEKYIAEIEYAFEPIFELIPSISEFDHIHLSLEYIDFFEVDFKTKNVFGYLNDYLNTTIAQSFMNDYPHGVDLELSYKDKELGLINFSYRKGKVMNKSEGLIVRTSIDSGKFPSGLHDILIWFDSAHSKCSQLFKEMTKGELYETFQ